MSASGPATTLPTSRRLSSSSRLTTATLYGASGSKAGRSGRCGTTNDHTRPRPDMRSHLESSERHQGHIGRGGKRRRPQLAQTCILSSPWAVPSQKGALSASTSGNGASSITALPLPQQQGAGRDALAARDERRFRPLDLARRGAADLASSLGDQVDAVN